MAGDEPRRVLGQFTDYLGMLEIVRSRVRELEIGGTSFDQFAGLPDKYLAKLIGEHPIRRIGMTSMGPLFNALGVRCVVVEDPEATERLRKRLRPRNGSFVRPTRTHRVITDRLWRRIQKLGSAARWQNTTKRQRSEIMREVALRRWNGGNPARRSPYK